MTDKEKLNAIRVEVQNYIDAAHKAHTNITEGNFAHLLSFIDSLQEEPVSIWHDASEEPKPNMALICVGQYGNPLVLSSNSDSFKSRDISKWAYFNDLLNLSNIQRTVKNWKKPVSEDLEEEIRKYFLAYKGYPHIMDKTEREMKKACIYFANWQKQQMTAKQVLKVLS